MTFCPDLIRKHRSSASLLNLVSCVFLFGWSSRSVFIMSKTVITSIAFSWILWIVPANYETCRGYYDSKIYNQSARNMSVLGTPNVVLTPEVRAVLLGILTCGFCSYSGWLVPKLNCITTSWVSTKLVYFRKDPGEGSQTKIGGILGFEIKSQKEVSLLYFSTTSFLL